MIRMTIAWAFLALGSAALCGCSETEGASQSGALTVQEIRARLDYLRSLAALERAKGTLLEARGLQLSVDPPASPYGDQP